MNQQFLSISNTTKKIATIALIFVYTFSLNLSVALANGNDNNNDDIQSHINSDHSSDDSNHGSDHNDGHNNNTSDDNHSHDSNDNGHNGGEDHNGNHDNNNNQEHDSSQNDDHNTDHNHENDNNSNNHDDNNIDHTHDNDHQNDHTNDDHSHDHDTENNHNDDNHDGDDDHNDGDHSHDHDSDDDSHEVQKGTITVCKIITNSDSVIATTSTLLPAGNFSISLGTTTSISSTTVSVFNFSSASFVTNTKLLGSSNGNDADCIKVTLPYGTYYYSPESISGASASDVWGTPKYNDQSVTPFTSLSTVYSYSAQLFDNDSSNDSLVNTNSDGMIVVDSAHCNRALVFVNSYSTTTPVINPSVNHPPVITLVGTTPMTLNLGDIFTDPGATATDVEDGNLTGSIVAGGTVNTTVVGSYSVIYGVTDSGGLSAGATRAVNVVPIVQTQPGKITFCMMVSDNQNNVITSSSTIPAGLFAINLATSTNFASTTINSRTWNATLFAPNTGIINTSGQDADCVSFINLPLGTYYYSEVNPTGSLWNTPKYNDESTQSINNVFDFFSYSPELFTATTTDDATRNMNSDGQIILVSGNSDKTLVVLNKFNPASNGGSNSQNANISLSKTIDKTTANVGDTVTYTITVSNAGPDTALAVTASDTLPSTLTFVSATSILGTYSTTTNMWNIGNLANGSSTALTIVAKINTGTLGQTIINTAVASSTVADSDITNNTNSVNLVVTSPVVVTTGNGGGGGGGGNGPPVGLLSSGGGNNGPVVTISGSGSGSCYYLYDYLRKDFNNNPVEVKKLQVFLKTLEGFTNLEVTGVYDDATIKAVDAFQMKYKDDILTPWGHDAPTDYTYILTKKKINEIYCKMAFPVTPGQQSEIDAFRSFLLGLKNAGVNLGSSRQNGHTTIPAPTTLINNTVGKANTGKSGGKGNPELSTLAGVSTTTQNITNGMVANAISSGKKLANLALAIIAWPFGSMFGKLLNFMLFIIIIVISYLWYREYKNNRKIEEINKEIDLNN